MSWEKEVNEVALHKRIMRTLWVATITAFALMASAIPAATGNDARDPFSGRWRPDTQTIDLSKSRLSIALVGRGFGRSTGGAVDALNPADGQFHAVKSDGYVDSTAVAIVSSEEVRETNKVKGRIVYESRYVLSDNGRKLTWFVTSFANATRTGVESSTAWQRVSGSEDGKHGVAGEWQQTGISLRDDTNDWLLKLSGTSFSNRSPQGSGYAAQLGGPAVPNEGDSSGATVSVVRPDPNTIVEYHALKGKVGAVLVLQAGEDVTSIKAIAITPKSGKATSFILRRIGETQ